MAKQSIDWEQKKEEAFKALARVRGLKGVPFEVAYNVAYNRLVAQGKRMKLKGKYSVR